MLAVRTCKGVPTYSAPSGSAGASKLGTDWSGFATLGGILKPGPQRRGAATIWR